jgi:hypothetical protein
MGIGTRLVLFSYLLLGHLSNPSALPHLYSKRDIDRICLSYGGDRIGSEDFERWYKSGAEEVSEDEDDHWEGDDANLVLEYENSAKMIDTNALLMGPPTPHFKGEHDVLPMARPH